MAEKSFVAGMIVKIPPEQAPDWVKLKISFKVDELIACLQAHQSNGWVNADLKKSQKGTYYCEIDTWRKDGRNSSQPQQQDVPKQAPQGGVDDQEIPF